MDAIKLLTADHNRVRGLFTRFKAAKEKDDTETMRMLAEQIITELEVHTTIEEEIFYPWAKERGGEVAELVTEGVEEHHVVKTTIAEAQELEPTDEVWTAKLTVIMENVEHHAEEEETEMFPKLRSAVSADDLEQLTQQMEARKAELGAPTLADKIDLTTEELRDLASKQEIPGRSKMDREELAATVSPQ